MKKPSLCLKFNIEDKSIPAAAVRAGLLSLLSDLPALKDLHLRLNIKVINLEEAHFWAVFIKGLKILKNLENFRIDADMLTSECATVLRDAVNEVIVKKSKSMHFDKNRDNRNYAIFSQRVVEFCGGGAQKSDLAGTPPTGSKNQRKRRLWF